MYILRRDYFWRSMFAAKKTEPPQGCIFYEIRPMTHDIRGGVFFFMGYMPRLLFCPGVPPRRPTGLPVLRQISTVPYMPWQLAAAIRLGPARNAVQDAALMAPAATLTIHTRAPVTALALAQLLPQNHDLAA